MARVSDRPWSSFTQADYTPEQWRRACLIDTGEGDEDTKSRYRLPVREPDGTLNRNGVHAAAARLNQVQGITPEQRRTAARELVSLYRNQLDEEPPESLLQMAGMLREGRAADGEVLPPRQLGMEVRATDFQAVVGDGFTLEGYAAVFDQETRVESNTGVFLETIRRGAFHESLERRKPVLQFEHGRDPRVGQVPIGAIQEIREDPKGLYVRARLFDNPVVEPIRQAIAGGAIRGMSFRFQVPEGGDEWRRSRWRSDDLDRRFIYRADVFEVGPVVHPAYDATTVSVRSLLSTFGPSERAALIRELAAELRAAVDLRDLTGRSAQGAGGGDPDNARTDEPAESSSTNPAARARHRALQLERII